MRTATIYEYKGRYIISSLSKTTAGVYVGERPPVVIDNGVEAQALGKAVLDALERCRENVPHPSDWTSLMKGFLAAAGAKSWSAFGRASSSVILEEEGGQVTVIPQRRDETGRGGSLGVPERALKVSAVSADAVGRAIRQGLNDQE